MKVKDITNIHLDFGFADTKVDFLIKPKGSNKIYYDSTTHLWRNHPEVAEMEVTNWAICDARRNKCTFVILVERNEEYEAKRKEAWERLSERSNANENFCIDL